MLASFTDLPGIIKTAYEYLPQALSPTSKTRLTLRPAT